jgi:hypothetical protein
LSPLQGLKVHFARLLPEVFCPLFEMRATLTVDEPGAAARYGSMMNTRIIAAMTASIFWFAFAAAQTTTVVDPTVGFDRPFGLGGRACKQYDDTGRLYLYSEGLPSIGVLSWLEQSDGGTKANVPMPEELSAALPLIPACMPGKHHAALTSR